MEVEIIGLNDQGLGVSFFNNKITFVENTVIGDIVNIEIIKSNSKYNIAKVNKYIKKSDKRVREFCPYFMECGGCTLQNISYEDTLEYKKNKVQRCLHKFADIDIEVNMISSTKEKNYRNKLTLKVKDKQVGFYSYNTNKLIKIENCMLASKSINNFIKEINNFNIINGEIIIRSNYKDELLINFITDDKLTIPNLNDLKIVGILQNNKIIKGNNYFIDSINDKLFNVSYDSFFQINRDVAGKIFNIIKDNILKNKNVLDLYCGVGTLGINVGDISNKIYGIEIVENAIENSILNAKINKLDNCNYMLGDASSIIDKIKDNIDVIILDPPRSGISKHEIDVILNINPMQIIYVSCDPITLSRDLKLLSSKYKLKKVYALDMFAYTYHVETVCILENSL